MVKRMVIDIPRLRPIETPPNLLGEPALRVRKTSPEPMVPHDPSKPDPQRWHRRDGESHPERRRARRRQPRKIRRIESTEMRTGIDRRQHPIIDIEV